MKTNFDIIERCTTRELEVCMTDAEIIREVETQVLDVEYRRFRLVQRRSMLAVGHVLKVFGDAVRELNRGIGATTFEQARFGVNGMTYGLSHCLRWLLANQVSSVRLPDERPETLDGEAIEFLKWGIDYAFLANDHTARNRGYIRATVDRPLKAITFHLPPDASGPHFVRQIEAQQATINERVQSRPDNVLRGDFNEWSSQLSFSNGEMRADYGRRPDAVTQAVREWLGATVLPDLAGNTELDGFLLDDFRAFVGALLPFCLYHCWFEDVADRTLGETHPYGSRPLVMPRRRFVWWLSRIAELPEEPVASIVDTLTFDASRFHERVIYRPLLALTDRTVLASPRLWSLLDIERLLVGALNSSGRKHVYDRLINDVESARVEAIATALGHCTDWELVCQRRFRTAEKLITPDLVIWEPRSDRILVIDYKHVMEAGGVVEVVNKLKEFSKWRQKMDDYCKFLRTQDRLLNDAFPRRNTHGPATSVDGLILSRWPLPLPSAVDPDIPIADWPGLRGLLSRGRPSVESVLTWAAERPEVSQPAELKVVSQEIHVGEWKYIRSTLTTDLQARP